MSLATEFRDFILRGNVVDLAVGIVIGGAFGAVVNALVKDIITPIISIPGSTNFSDLTFSIGGGKFLYGDFLNAVIAFLSIAGQAHEYCYISTTNAGGCTHHQGLSLLPQRSALGGQPLRVLHIRVEGSLTPYSREYASDASCAVQANAQRRRRSYLLVIIRATAPVTLSLSLCPRRYFVRLETDLTMRAVAEWFVA